MGCLPIHKLHMVKLVFLGKINHQGIDIVDPFSKYFKDVSGFVDDS